ncbi:MAG: hypothetical protein IJG00_03080 [Clostridia bacterium]|nr:hypothetical protein [Clostridia bacterium]
MNDNKPKNGESAFALNDIIKRKILEMYKISKTKNTTKKTSSKNKKTSDVINNSKQNRNTN